MILKERLEELIKEKATIFTPDNLWQTIGTINLSKNCYIDEDNNRLCNNKITFKDLPNASAMYSIPLEELYEAKEEAEWYLNFGNITRMETLSLPSWEKMKKRPRIVEFISKNYKRCKLSIGEIIAVTPSGTRSAKKRYVCVCIDKDDYYFERTEKGYIEACKLCKKLFLGREV